MTDEKFTPGPWTYSEGMDGEFRIYAPVFPGAERAVFDVADVWLPDAGDRAANGRLIAAAPDLYEALQEVSRAMTKLTFEGIDRGKGHWPAWDDTARAVDKARAALAKVSKQVVDGEDE